MYGTYYFKSQTLIRFIFQLYLYEWIFSSKTKEWLSKFYSSFKENMKNVEKLITIHTNKKNVSEKMVICVNICWWLCTEDCICVLLDVITLAICLVIDVCISGMILVYVCNVISFYVHQIRRRENNVKIDCRF